MKDEKTAKNAENKNTPESAQEQPKAEKVTSVSFIKDSLNQVAAVKKDFNETQLAFVKGVVNPDLKDTELFIFLEFSSRLQLNPLIGEIIPVVYNKNNPDRRVNYIITRNGKRVVATRTGELDGIKTEAIYIKDVEHFREDLPEEKRVYTQRERVEAWAGGELWGAECTVVRNGNEFKVTVPRSEYDTKANVWKSKPETMIKKVAESQALSAAFPEILGITYDEVENDSIDYKPLPQDADNDRVAEEAQLETIKSLGGEVEEGMTYNQAVVKIDELANSKKGNKK